VGVDRDCRRAVAQRLIKTGRERGSQQLIRIDRPKMDGRFAGVPDELSIAPCLPLLGINTIIANKLRLLVDGPRRQFT
jgi:hypothetical protein